MIMRRKSIDHILRAAAEVTKNKRFVMIGSAALMARMKHVPLNMMYTPEIDIYAPDADDIELASELIDGSIGQGSQFHSQFGYYGDGVSPSTSKMPNDWSDRAIEYQGEECPGVVAVVPEENDVALAKLSAWRDKDRTWLIEGVKAGVLSLPNENGEPARSDARTELGRKPARSRYLAGAVSSSCGPSEYRAG